MKISSIATATFLILNAVPHDAFVVTTTPMISSQRRVTHLSASTLPETKDETKISTTNEGETTSASSSSDVSSPPLKNAKDDALKSTVSFTERVTNSGIASATMLATAAVNSAVSMKTLEAPTVTKSFISMDESSGAIDEDGLPLSYDSDLINAYWRKERGALSSRWNYFVSKAVPFLTRLVTLFITEGKIDERHFPSLSRQARLDIQDLGPTFIKAGQMMSVRPDVLPQVALDELGILQDSVVPFATSEAIDVIERELGGTLNEFFSEISEEPVAAASLAQVYRATLRDGKGDVAIKVQRPDILSTVSKDLYVLRRAAEVFQGLVERFAPQQKTDYVALLNEWAIGFYTELDFQNEARNQEALRDIVKNVRGVFVPKVYKDLTTRRVLVSEWIDGKKLSQCTPEQIKNVTPAAQEAFLVQLFDAGFFHADPHPGNILMLDEPTPEGDQLALIDCGLMAQINDQDRDLMISAVIHLANKDYAALADDFINLQILPKDSDRNTIVPLMDKALSPYVKGGGAKKYEEELKKLYNMDDQDLQSQVGGFQAMTQDALTVLNDVPFSIPPYFAILGRAIVTLEGVALTGDQNYGIIMESYPFIARKLLKDDTPTIQDALQQVLFTNSNNSSPELKLNRLLALLNNAAGSVSTKEGSAFVDLDAIPEDSITFSQGLKYLMSDDAESLRNLLETEVDNVVDIVLRQIMRKAKDELIRFVMTPATSLARLPFNPFASNSLLSSSTLEQVPLPLLLPGQNGLASTPSVGVLSLKEFIDYLAPKLDQDEEIYSISIAEAAGEFFGDDAAEFVRGEGVISIDTAKLIFQAVKNGYFGGASDILSSDAVRQTLNSVSTLLNGLGNNDLDDSFAEVMNELNEEERQRFDDIIEELVRRCVMRAADRLATVPRVL